MIKKTYKKNLNYTFDPARKYNKYTLNDGATWMNHGDFCECLAKSVLGYAPIKDKNTRHDRGHDIPELKASVKSCRGGLTDRKDLGNDPTTYVKNFFASELPNTKYIWVHDYDEYVDLYFMGKREFKKFVKYCGKWDTYCQKIRFNLAETKIIAYLEKELNK